MLENMPERMSFWVRAHEEVLMSLEAFSQVIDKIYSAALDADLWHAAMAAIDQAVGGRGGMLGIDAAGRPGFLSVTGYDQEALTSFASYYASKSYVWSLVLKATEGGVIHDRRVMASDRRRHDVFANEWATQHDTGDCVAFPLLKRTDRTAFAVFARSRARGEFDAPELDFLRRLSPHLRRTAQIRVELDRSELCPDLTLEAIDKLHDGVIFATADGAVTNLNASAERLLTSINSGISISQGRLRCARADQTMKLQKLLAQASGIDKVSQRQGGALTVHREHEAKSLTVLCVPLGESRRWSLDRQPTVLLLLSDTARSTRASADLLRDLFGLTPAETRLAIRLGGGMSLTDAAAELGVAKATVRSQLNAVFQKTQTNRQGELVQLLNTLPRVSDITPPR
jgi:DNA-binding CsgD family transcriptional regulator